MGTGFFQKTRIKRLFMKRAILCYLRFGREPVNILKNRGGGAKMRTSEYVIQLQKQEVKENTRKAGFVWFRGITIYK